MINPYEFVEELSEALTPEHVIVIGSSGSASEIMQQAFKVKTGQRVICSPGLGSMGFGLPQSIGVSYATDRPIVAVIGDGCIQHNIQELHSMRGRNIKLFVWNNGGYNSIKNMQDRLFQGRRIGCGDELPDIKIISSSYRIYPVYMEWISSLTRLKSITDNHEDSRLPEVIEVIIDPEIKTAPRIKNQIIDGKFVSGKLEDVC